MIYPRTMENSQRPTAIVDKFYEPNDPGSSSKSTYQLPRSTASCFSLAQDNCCTATIFTVDEVHNQCEAVSEAELAAFLPSGDTRHSVELSCHANLSSLIDEDSETYSSSFRLNFDEDVQRVQLLTLPWTNENFHGKVAVHTDLYQAIGVVVVATTLSRVSARSIVLARSSPSEAFRLSEVKEITEKTETSADPSDERRIREVHARLVITETESPVSSDEPLIEPLLLIATSSTGAGITPKKRAGASQRVDVKAYKMAEHICPLFRFNACAHGSRPQGMHVQALSGRYNQRTRYILHDVGGVVLFSHPYSLYIIAADAGRVKGLSISATGSGHNREFALAVLSPFHFQSMKLPPFQLWNGQALPLQQMTTVLLSGCHPTHSLGEAMSVACIDDSSEPSLSRFAILCRSHNVDIALTPAKAAAPRFEFAISPIIKERASPMYSPGVLNRSSSPSPIMMDRGGAPQGWTDKETNNAVLRARQALRSHNSNISPCKTLPVEPALTPQRSLQTFDESIIMGTPAAGKKKIEVLFSDDSSEANEFDKTIATPATAILDMTNMSEIWMENSPDPTIGASHLAGLNFIADESPMELTPPSRRMLLPPRSRRINFQTPDLQRGQSDASTTCPDNLSYLVLVNLEPRYQGGSQSLSFACKTFVAALPQHLSSFTAIDIKLKTSASSITTDEQNRSDLLFSPSPGVEGELAQSLILSAQSPSTQRIHVLSFALTKIGLAQIGPEESHDLRESIKDQIIGASSRYMIKSMAMEDLRLDENNLHIRVVFAVKPMSIEFEEKSKVFPFNLSTTEEFGVAVATVMLPFPSADPRESQATVAVEENPSNDKLDTILQAFKQFETNVTDRLNSMEKAIQENNARVTSMEKLIQEQAKSP
jgi:hypothetical protein